MVTRVGEKFTNFFGTNRKEETPEDGSRHSDLLDKNGTL